MVFCPLFSGSSGNSTFIATTDTAILIDAGVNASRLIGALDAISASPNDIKAIIITHEHGDHIKGIGVMARRYGIPIVANSGTWEAILSQNKVGDIPIEKRIYFEDNTTFHIGDIAITPFETHHDVASPVGYCIESKGTKATIVSDTGCISKKMKSHIAGTDLLMLEFNHDEHMLHKGRYPIFLKKRILSNRGHLSNRQAALALVYAAELGCKKFILCHLSKDNNTPEAAYDAAHTQLLDSNLLPNKEIEIIVAREKNVTKPLII